MIARRALFAAPLLLAASPIPAAAQPISRMDTRWWRERHAAKLFDATRGPIDLVFLGDSITQQYETDGPEPFRRFLPVWQRFYGDRRALNLGFSGDATCHLLWRLRNGEIDSIRPKVAIILIGANNLGRLHWPVPDNLAGIDAVVATTRQKLPSTKILLMGVLPSDRSLWATQSTTDINRALPGRHPGITFLDIAQTFMKSAALDHSLFYDERLSPPSPPLHPTAEGQALMAAAIEPTLARLLGDRPRT